MDETIYVILNVLFDFALEVWFSIYKQLLSGTRYLKFRLSIYPCLALCVQAVKALARMRICAFSSEPSLLAYAIST